MADNKADLVQALPSIPRRTLERDLQQLAKEKNLSLWGKRREGSTEFGDVQMAALTAIRETR